MPDNLDLDAIQARCAINIIFDGPPGPDAGRFVEVETDDGKSINAGTWAERPDGLWALRITQLPNDGTDLPALVEEVRLLRAQIDDELKAEGALMETINELRARVKELEGQMKARDLMILEMGIKEAAVHDRVKELEGQRTQSICCEGEGSNV